MEPPLVGPEEHVRQRMQRQAVRNTAPEINLRRELHRRGLRFRIHRRIDFDRRRTIDIVFPSQRLAIFVDGCFWHLCPTHAVMPSRNAEFWRAKLEANSMRDLETTRQLEAAGWTVIRVWEHADVIDAADEIESILASAKRTNVPVRDSQ